MAKNTGMTHIKDLIPDQTNRRKHNPRNIGMITDSLNAVGAWRSIAIDENDVVHAGNGVIEAAADAGITKLRVIDAEGDEIIAVRRRGLTDEQKRLAAMYDNRTSELAEWDIEQLQADAVNDLDLKPFFFEDEIKTLLNDGSFVKSGQTDPDAVPEQRQTDIQVGDLFELGDHRLLCGDVTSSHDVTKLTDGATISVLITDPPYGVSYGDKNKFLNSIDKGNRIQSPINHDHESPDDMSAFWRESFSSIRTVLDSGCSYYVTGPQGVDLLVLLMQAISDSGYPLKHMLIWAKNNHVLGRCDYHYKHEPILYGWIGTHKFRGEPGVTSLWEIDRPHSSKLHPTMKPVELYTRALANSSQSDDVALDPFAGSGTLVIACEQLGRTALVMEIDPSYCQVIIDRWEAFTGKKAVKQ